MKKTNGADKLVCLRNGEIKWDLYGEKSTIELSIDKVLRIVVNFTTIALVFLFFSVYTYSLKTNKTINRIESKPFHLLFHSHY